MFHQCVALSPSSNKPSLQLDSIAPVSFLLPTHKLKNEEKTANNMTYKQSRILNQFNIYKTKLYRINQKKHHILIRTNNQYKIIFSLYSKSKYDIENNHIENSLLFLFVLFFPIIQVVKIASHTIYINFWHTNKKINFIDYNIEKDIGS